MPYLSRAHARPWKGRRPRKYGFRGKKSCFLCHFIAKSRLYTPPRPLIRCWRSSFGGRKSSARCRSVTSSAPAGSFLPPAGRFLDALYLGLMKVLAIILCAFLLFWSLVVLVAEPFLELPFSRTPTMWFSRILTIISEAAILLILITRY